jgi:hypothetical protein
MYDSKPIYIRTESTFRYGVIAFVLFFIDTFVLLFSVPMGIILLVIAVSLLLSRQKTEIDIATQSIIRTEYPLFFPIRSEETIAGCNRITIFCERSSGVRVFFRRTVASRTEYCEIQFRRTTGDPVCFVEFPDHKSALDLAWKLSHMFNLPVEDLYQEWMNQIQANRERRRRAGFR